MPRIVQCITGHDRFDVAERVKAGLDEEEIATFLRMPVERLRRIFRRELEFNAVEGKYQVLAKLYEAAVSGENVNATIFSAKARYGWRDTGTPQTPAAEYVVRIETASNPQLPTTHD
jgi:hypothetical protein